MLTVTLTSTPGAMLTGRDCTLLRTRSATVWPKAGGQLGRIIANSSPPKRATVSIGRMHSCSAWPTARSTTSPAGWPWVSLTRLKWSMSIISTSAGSPARATRSISRAIASSNWRRLASPVSASRLESSHSPSSTACSQPAGSLWRVSGKASPDCCSNCSATSRRSEPALGCGGEVGAFKN